MTGWIDPLITVVTGNLPADVEVSNHSFSPRVEFTLLWYIVENGPVGMRVRNSVDHRSSSSDDSRSIDGHHSHPSQPRDFHGTNTKYRIITKHV
jgi:hypothetical protein